MDKPIKITAKCKLVTPMLSSGADQYKFEIRASGIKAGLRFWWRAFQPKNGKSLYAEESKIFGNTKLAALFDIHVSKTPDSILAVKKPGDTILSPDECKKKYGAGIAYAIFSITNPVTPKNPELKLKDISKSGRPIEWVDSAFQIQINFMRHDKAYQKIGDVLCALWLLENLSGLGGRTRRGAGCFEIQEIKMNDKTFEDSMKDESLKQIFEKGITEFSFQNKQTPDQYIKSGIDTVMKRWQTDSRIELPDYTAFYSNTSEVLVAYNGPKKDPDSALAMMGYINSQIKNYCFTFPYEAASQMHTSLSQDSPLPKEFRLDKATKGLPIIFNFTNNFEKLNSGRLDASYTATTVKTDNSGKPLIKNNKFVEGNARKASPLLISCHQKGGTAYAVISRLPAPLMPANEKIWLKTQNSELDMVLEPPRIPPFDKFVENLIHNKQEGTDLNSKEFEKTPIINAFNKVFSITPYKDISPKKLSSLDVKIEGNKNPIPENIASLLSQAKAIQQGDNISIEKLVKSLDSLCADETNEDCPKIAIAMKKRMEEIGIWKKHPKKFDIESYING